MPTSTNTTVSSAKSVLRAIRANGNAGEVAQGGSTITQQLVKLSLVGNERSIQRKIKEASLAIQLEDQLCAKVAKKVCKDKILEQYLNTVYLGRGAYGVEAAAELYFNKPASQLDYADAAVITSLVRNPNGYDPIKFPKVAATRRHVVLLRMQEEKLVTKEQAAAIDASPLPTQTFGRPTATTSQNLTYLETKVRDELLGAAWLAPTEELRRYLIFNGGLKITTTIDPRAQQIADATAANNPLGKANPESRVAMVSIEPATGAVRSIVGQVDVPDRGPVEIADPVGGRSSGSSFKPFTLIAAIESGYPVNSTISGAYAPLAKKKDWHLKDVNKNYPQDCPSPGQVELTKALAESNNCAFMRMQGAVGFDKVKATAVKLGIDAKTLDPTNSQPACFTIGCDALVRPIDMADAYSTIANDGRHNPAHFVSKVQDRAGKVLFQFSPPNEQVIEPDVSRQAITAMQQVITGGTATGAALPGGRPAAGKTGTTEVEAGANTDVWFIGFTPQITTAVWIGDPIANTALNGSNVQGGKSAALVWKAFMSQYLSGQPVVGFTPPSKTKGKAIPDPWSNSKTSSSSSTSKTATSKTVTSKTVTKTVTSKTVTVGGPGAATKTPTNPGPTPPVAPATP